MTVALVQSSQFVPLAPTALTAGRVARRTHLPCPPQSRAFQHASKRVVTPPTLIVTMVERALRTLSVPSPLTAPIAAHAAFPSPHRCRQEFRASQRVQIHAHSPPTASAAMAAKAQSILTATSPLTAPIVARAVLTFHLQCR